MDGGIDGNAPLDFATIKILPSQNRYEAFICKDDKLEKLAIGILEKLLPHLPGVSSLSTKGSNANLKLQLSETTEWFTKSTLSRFLQIVSSTGLADPTKSIEGEMSQLEEARKFHLSLYKQDEQCHSEDKEADGCNSKDMVQTSESEVQISSSDASKNELLRAIDLRLAALQKELVAAFDDAAGTTCSCEEITHLVSFCENFGATNLKNLFCKIVEMKEQSQITRSLGNGKPSLDCTSSENNSSMPDRNAHLPKAVHTETPVKYGVSPAKVARIERQSSTGSEGSSDSSEENQTSAERSRTLIRSASPRRSASPMRRVQIGRTGSRRAPALTIKSLSYFPARDKSLAQRDLGAGSSDEEGGGPAKKPENDTRRMSVQDAINLFESKQRDQKTDNPLKSSLKNLSLGANKSVLRRWSAGAGESLAQCEDRNVTNDSSPEIHDKEVDRDIPGSLAEVSLESDSKDGVQENVEAHEVDIKLEDQDAIACSPVDILAIEDMISEKEKEANGRLRTSTEWTQKKEAELNEMFMKMMESQPVRGRKVQANARDPSEQRGGLYGHYKEKRDEKLQAENGGQRTVKEAQVKNLQKSPNEMKTEIVSTNLKNNRKKLAPQRPQKSESTMKNLTKSLKNPSPQSNPAKDAPKPSVPRKALPKTSPLPATRKSWPSAPSPRTAAGTTPAKISSGISSAGTTPTHRKSQPPSSLPQTGGKVERPKQQKRSMKENQTETAQKLKVANEKKQPRVAKSSKASKKVAAEPGDSSGELLAKPTLSNKGNTKSTSALPETKPYLRKGSRISSTISPAERKKTFAHSEDSMKKSEDKLEVQQHNKKFDAPTAVSDHEERSFASQNHSDVNMDPETGINDIQNSGDLEKSYEVAAADDVNLKHVAELSLHQEESTISPTAWVEIEEQQEMLNQCGDNTAGIPASANTLAVGLASPRVRYSLSQMLQEEISEPETMEWGNAENPPAMVYQRDVPKGLKRLLKFARKSKGDVSVSGLSSPSVFSEGEDEAEESKSSSRRNADNLLRKAALHATHYGQPKLMSVEGYERQMDIRELSSAQSGLSKLDAQVSHKLQKASASMAASGKGTRSFFSLSAFRAGKPS